MSVSNALLLARQVLSKSERARDCDKHFLLCCLRAQGMVVKVTGNKFVVEATPEQWSTMYSFETLTRARRLLQNDYCEFRPSLSVARAREVQESRVREEISSL